MIEVIVNLVPFGQREYTRPIAGAKIWNDASGDSITGNYGYELLNDRGKIVYSGEVKGFKRAKGVEHLIKEVLNDAL